MIDATGGFVVALGLLAIELLSLGILAHLRARTLRHLRKAERIRGIFAEARDALVLKGLRREIDVESETYRSLYYIQTSMMRRDDQYEAMWPTLVKTITTLKEPRHADGLAHERPRWSPEVTHIAGLTVSGIEAILLEYSIILRSLVPILNRIGSMRKGPAPIAAAVPPLTERVEVFETRRRAERKDVRAFLPALGGHDRMCATS